MRRFTFSVLLLLCASGVQGQIISVPNRSLTRPPAFVLGGTVGVLALQGIFDGETRSSWDFSQGLEFGGSLEKTLGRGSAFGVSAAYSRMPLRYVDSTTVAPDGRVLCCNAHVDVLTAGAQFTAGGGAGFHQVIMASAGVIVFRNFDVRSNQVANPPPAQDIDPRLAIGYGIGYGFSERSEAFLIQEYGVALHQGKGLSGNDRRQYQQQTTRVGFRVGGGSRRGP